MDFSRYKILTFDCYGTLIDWENGILHAVRPVLARHGVAAQDRRILETYADIEAKQEGGGYVRYELLLRMLMAEMSLRLGFDATPEELDCVSTSIKDWTPFADTVPALTALKKRCELAILSNIDDRLFAATAVRLRVPFDHVITAQQARAYKPSPAFFDYALEHLGHPGSEILHVAQSLYHDIAPAKGRGLSTVWVNRRKGLEGSGATPEADVEPDLQVPDLATLVRLMGL
jgi:2-haloacid dehalogenase